MDKENAGGGPEVMKSEDPGETLEEAGLAEEGDDGASVETDPKDGEAEPDEAGDEDSDAGAEGEETDRAGKPDAEADSKEGVPTELDALKEILKQRDTELQKFKESEKAQAAPAPEPMTEEKWLAVEEKFGGLSRHQIQPLAELVDRGAREVESRMEARLARIEKDLTINAMAEQEGTRDIRSFRKEIDEFLGNFDPKTHANPKLLGMALAYARGVKNGSAGKNAESKERKLRVVGAGKPNTSGGSAGGSPRGVKLTAMERQAAKAGGMSEREYYQMRYGSGKK